MAISTDSTLNVTGKSGTVYSFYLHPIGTSYKKIGGVYFFVKKTADSYTPIYVGITNDLSERFDDHHKMSCIKKNGATHLLTRAEEDEKKRQTIEKDILLAINTSCNEVHN